MSSGWGCQYMGRYQDRDNWCMKLSHECDPGCKGCVIYNQVTSTQPNISEDQQKKVKNRSDHPLKNR
ncbi:MAG TPA: hypothetical protein CFH81_02720 [Sulfurovum sp. UBA12169]|nr:MAG TPA: hypothetical protein CFH81_02720 [Sulfurovum sp. UBA12169]